jgi:hypothetical protein
MTSRIHPSIPNAVIVTDAEGAEITLVNCTPHPVSWADAEGNIRLTIPRPPNGAARIDQIPGSIGSLAGMPIMGANVYGGFINLPPETPGTLHVVSIMFSGRAGARQDLIIPGTGPQDNALRDAQGQVVACRRWVRA